MQEKDLSTLATFKRLFPIIKQYKSGIIIGAIALVLNALVDSGLIYLLKPLLDEGFGQADHGFLKLMSVLVVAFILVRGITNYVAGYCLAWSSGNVVMTLRRTIFQHLIYMPVSYFDKNPIGRSLSRVTYDTEMVANSSSHALVTIVREGAYLISLFVVMIYTSWQLSMVLFMLAPVIGVLIGIVSKRFRQLSRNIQSSMGELTVTTEQMLKGHKEVLSFGGQEIEKARFDRVSNDMRRKGMKIVSALSIILYLSTVEGLHIEDLTAGSFTVVFSSMMAMLRPLKSLTNVNSQFQRGMAACQTLFEFLDLKTENDNGTVEVERAKGNITFNHVSFGYEGKDGLALNDISFSLPQGKTIALVGRSGSGKSTIANLLTRFYDIEQGEITLDGINIQDYRLANLRAQCSIVSQQVHLFNDTIANNIAYAATDKYSREDIINAAKAAHAMEFIEKLDDGLDTVIGENGASLSGGQRQRLAIARALLRNSPILVLDEATSALDTESERAIQSALAALQKDKTVLVIAHRLSTIENADEILVVDQGKIIERGTHQALLAQNGAYSQLYSLQFGA